MSILPCADPHIEDTVRGVYGELHGDANDYNVHVLSMTKAGCGGATKRHVNLPRFLDLAHGRG